MDLVCFGELLIDFVATATGPLRAAPGFIKAAGGAPANVAVAAARLGCETAFIGAAGKDEFGSFLNLSRWATDISPFSHVPKLPGGTFTATPLLWLTAIAVALIAVGMAALRRRDLA